MLSILTQPEYSTLANSTRSIMTISRRHFLQFAASTLATLGLSQFDIQRQGLRYARVLAQSTPRKLALLVEY